MGWMATSLRSADQGETTTSTLMTGAAPRPSGASRRTDSPIQTVAGAVVDLQPDPIDGELLTGQLASRLGEGREPQRHYL